MGNVELFARTEIGCVRERNEDAFLVLSLATGERSLRPEVRVQALGPPGTVLAVCDGMGGAAGGDVAATIAIDVLAQTAQRYAPIGDITTARHVLLQAVAEANHSIARYAVEHDGRQGMGTTMTAAVLFGTQLAIVQIGDSRAYLRRGRSLQQLTVDQSLVGQLIMQGKITVDEARTFEQRNVLLQALGVAFQVTPEFLVTPVKAGDVLLLCSDGLSGTLTDQAMVDIMVRYEDPMRCCRALTEAACAAGGPDNVTVAIARFTGDDLPVSQGRDPITCDRMVYTV